MEHVAALSELQELLKPLEVVVWGEAAMASLGVPVVPHNIMLVPSEQDYAAVLDRVEREGFRNTPWSYGSLDPADIEAHPESKRLRQIHATADQHYMILNIHSTRYKFPSGRFPSLQLLFLRPDYVDLGPPLPSTPDGPSSCQDGSIAFTRQGIFLYPDVSTLLKSFIRTGLKDEDGKTWKTILYVWITSYICVYLPVRPDSLDGCKDESVKELFSQLIQSDFVTRWDRSRNS
ncbi:hypothetical protein PT974_12451 [Cladobotryum mycophilum]|uniref:Uncharacterized protein n=1 Tax=Cladobotryum mycophilum TaxID=491253 RepID=A0ABR0S813_9HYPO